MKTSKMKIWIGCGIFCVLSILISSWYAVTFNDSRLVRLMDFMNYTFGRMSGTFMDERFRENIVRAKLKAYRITFDIMFFALVILCQGKLFGSLEYTLIAVIIMLSLALALGMFLSEYLLYRYDHDDQIDEGEK